MTQAYALTGRKIASKPYHYTQCGLDDIYLLNGYKRHKTPYGGGVAIENVEGLHNAIAESLCRDKAFLSGKEFRFLRKLMDLTQAEVATYLGCDVQSIARWEKGQSEIKGPADRLMRLLYLGCKHINVEAAEIIRRVSMLDAKIADKQVFEESEGSWKMAA